MKKFLFFLLFLPLLSCNTLIKGKSKSIDYNCPSVFFSANEKYFVDTLNNSSSFDDVFIKAELNNFAISKNCQQNDELIIIPLDILIILKPMQSLPSEEVSLPLYITLLDQNDNVIETQYFMLLESVKKNSETGTDIETDINNTLEIISNKIGISQIVVGFMLDENKRKLLN
jgi:hypothetical protein